MVYLQSFVASQLPWIPHLAWVSATLSTRKPLLLEVAAMQTLAKCVANPNMTVPYLLMASAIYYHGQYYHFRQAPTDDHEFDLICSFARQNWNAIHHRHKHLITLEDLDGGSLYALKWEDYPLIVKHAAYAWMQTHTVLGVSTPTAEIAELLRRIADALCQFVAGVRLDDLV